MRGIDTEPFNGLLQGITFFELGAAYWMQGNVVAGIANWRKALKCSYGDAAGNLVPAPLLYYAAVRLSDANLLAEAVRIIEKKLKSGWSKNWPAPIGRYLIGQVDEEVVKGADLDGCVEWTKPDEGCRWDFYRGVKHLERSERDRFLARTRQIRRGPPKSNHLDDRIRARRMKYQWPPQ